MHESFKTIAQCHNPPRNMDTFEILPTKFKRVDLVDSCRLSLEEKVGATVDLQVHPLDGKPFGGIEHDLSYSAPQRIKTTLRAGRVVLIPQGNEILAIQPEKEVTDSRMVRSGSIPSGKFMSYTASSLVPILLTNQGEFYSVKEAVKLSTNVLSQ
jgi:hypothetical protein